MKGMKINYSRSSSQSGQPDSIKKQKKKAAEMGDITGNKDGIREKNVGQSSRLSSAVTDACTGIK